MIYEHVSFSLVAKLFIKSGGGKMLEFLSVNLKLCLPFSKKIDLSIHKA
jgi:hypothetical protein